MEIEPLILTLTRGGIQRRNERAVGAWLCSEWIAPLLLSGQSVVLVAVQRVFQRTTYVV